MPEFQRAGFLEKQQRPRSIAPYLSNSLDLGESSVIQLALDEQIDTVCIDEAVGRRVARLNGLKITGSIGILLRGKKQGMAISLRVAIAGMQANGIYLSPAVINFALTQAGEKV